MDLSLYKNESQLEKKPTSLSKSKSESSQSNTPKSKQKSSAKRKLSVGGGKKKVGKKPRLTYSHNDDDEDDDDDFADNYVPSPTKSRASITKKTAVNTVPTIYVKRKEETPVIVLKNTKVVPPQKEKSKETPVVTKTTPQKVSLSLNSISLYMLF